MKSLLTMNLYFSVLRRVPILQQSGVYEICLYIAFFCICAVFYDNFFIMTYLSQYIEYFLFETFWNLFNDF